jgi:hypothetical protein
MTNQAQNDADKVLARVDRFRSRDLAVSYAYGPGVKKPLAVMLGDDARYWVATLADCSRLESMGYEWAV